MLSNIYKDFCKLKVRLSICKIKCIEHRIWNAYHNAIQEYIQQTECRIITSTANERNELNGRNGLWSYG